MPEIDINDGHLDIVACLENLDHYAQAGDARSCRDIGLALARELTAVREQADRLREWAEKLVALDDPQTSYDLELRWAMSWDRLVAHTRGALEG